MRYLKQEALPRLLAAASIVDLAAERGLTPQDLGGRVVARCPFCQELELVLERRTNRFRCMSCGEWGNGIGLVCRLDQLSFMGALRRVAERAGLDFDDLLTEQCDCRACSQSAVPLWALTPAVELSR